MIQQPIKRLLEQRLPKSNENTLALITGARQTGKTTLIKSAYPELAYYNLDAVEYRDQLDQVSSFAWGKKVGRAILDEIQKAPALLDKIKYAFDSRELSFSALLGSAQILLMKSIRESLAGRLLIYELWPLTLSELHTHDSDGFKEPLFARLCGKEAIGRVMEAFPLMLPPEETSSLEIHEEHLLEWGGMPGLLHVEKERRGDWMRSYLTTYLERDLGDLSRLHDLKPFTTFERLAALRVANLLSYSELARDSGISVETARRYLEYLKISYQAFLLPPYSSNQSKTLIKTPKIYWVDTGLWRKLAETPGLSNGAAFENYVVAEIYKYIRTLDPSIRLFFYRTQGGTEVDLLLESNGLLLGIEIKSSDRASEADTGGLKRLAQQFEGCWAGGIVAYRGKTIQELSKNIWAVPTFRLLA